MKPPTITVVGDGKPVGRKVVVPVSRFAISWIRDCGQAAKIVIPRSHAPGAVAQRNIQATRLSSR
ncbi:MAG: hypothetical protein WAW37_10130, partial [Syntrophobacteraceae bacterium]